MKFKSDSLAAVDKEKADSLTKAIAIKGDIIYKLQNALRDSTSKLISLNQSLKENSLESLKMINGGESFLECYIRSLNQIDAHVSFEHHGKYPLSNINIIVLDHNLFNKIGKTKEAFFNAATTFNYIEVSPKTSVASEKLKGDFTKDTVNFLYSIQHETVNFCRIYH